jgi:nucleotide-binding universal stress UspA family protein
MECRSPVSRSVVIALDKSDLSARALPFARSIARQWGGQVVLVHATVRDDQHAPVPLDLQLRELVRSLGEEGINADAVVRTASPAQAIADVASERNADLIVMASHQRYGLNRWLNGSVTEDVLLKTSAPLLVVPAGGEPASGSSVRVLVPLDGSAVGEAPLDFLRARATRPMEVILVRVVSLRPVVVGLEPAVAAQALSGAELEAEVREAGEYLAQRAETLSGARISARYRVVEATEPIARVILETAKREHVDVIALGTHAKAGVSRLVLGSVSEEILEHSPIPVLLVRQKRAAGTEYQPREFIANRFG